MSRGRPLDPPQEPVELPPRVKHGGFQAYQVYKCRCGPCQDHHRSYQRAAAAVRRKIRYIPADVVHGTKSTYNYYGCRCEACCEARRSYDRERWELKERVREMTPEQRERKREADRARRARKRSEPS